MKVYKIIFSPTGGTNRVADILVKSMGSDKETIDLSEAEFASCELKNDGIAVIAMPSFSGRPPKIAIERLSRIKADKGIKAVIVAVYGNRAQEDTIIEMADTAKKSGFDVIAAVSAIAEHSIARQYATGRPDKEDEIQLERFTEQIMEKINNKSNSEFKIPGNHPYKKAGAGLIPKASSDCVKCGLCALKCPVGAINKENPEHTDKNVCINCMRCVSICPEKARKVNWFMLKIVGFVLRKVCRERKSSELFI